MKSLITLRARRRAAQTTASVDGIIRDLRLTIAALESPDAAETLHAEIVGALVHIDERIGAEARAVARLLAGEHGQ